MQKLGLKGKCKRRKYSSYQGKVGKIADNLLKRDFSATAPNEKWATDITEFKCAEGKLYLSPIKDLFNGEIIAYDLAESPNFDEYIHYYNNERIQVKLKGLSPVEYGIQSLS
ncbi:transposase insK for insertion sequence element IS150 [Actinobacillus seminis]|nr:transposase insK for insertion sequence element IS150 [Actinobacillus seminis]